LASVARIVFRTRFRSASFPNLLYRPISNRQRLATRSPQIFSARLQAGSPAIQEVENLRYDFVHGRVGSEVGTWEQLAIDWPGGFF
jgi:hypothetical protein